MGCGASSSKVDPAEEEVEMSFADLTQGQMVARQKAVARLTNLPPPDPDNPDDVQDVIKYILEYSADEKAWFMGVPPKGATRAACLRWLTAALEKQAEHGAGHPLQKGYKDICYWLLANSRLWEDWKNPDEPGFKALKDLAAKKLDSLTEATERDVYKKMNLGEILGGLGAGLTVHPRQDTNAGLCWPPEFELKHKAADFPDFVCFVRLAACALDKGFQAKAREAYITATGAPPKNRNPPVKGFMRMGAKLESDHKEEEVPKPAANVDCVRTAWIMKTDKFTKCYEEAEKAFGTPIRVKNNYAPDFDVTTTNGYRAMLVNYIYESGKTWGEMTEELKQAVEEVQEDRVNVTTRAVGATEFAKQWARDRVSDTATAFEYDEMKAKPAKMVVEIQFMTTEYYEMRKKTNAWYKIRRAHNAYGMKQDYIGGLTDD